MGIGGSSVKKTFTKAEIKLASAKLVSYIEIIIIRKQQALKNARKDLLKSLSSKSAPTMVELNMERVIGLEKDINCLNQLKTGGQRIVEQSEAIAAAKSIKDINSLLVPHIANIVLAYESYNLKTVTNLKEMMVNKFGTLDVKAECYKEVLAAVKSQISEEEKRNFARNYAEENSIDIQLFGAKYSKTLSDLPPSYIPTQQIPYPYSQPPYSQGPYKPPYQPPPHIQPHGLQPPPYNPYNMPAQYAPYGGNMPAQYAYPEAPYGCNMPAQFPEAPYDAKVQQKGFDYGDDEELGFDERLRRLRG